MSDTLSPRHWDTREVEGAKSLSPKTGQIRRASGVFDLPRERGHRVRTIPCRFLSLMRFAQPFFAL